MKEYISGGLSGIAQILVGYPLDTMKVLKQNNIKINMKNSLNYNGVKYPLQLSIISNSIVFGISNTLNKYNNYQYSTNKKINNNINMFINGYVAGIVSSPFVYIYDIKKTNVQTNNNNKLKDFMIKSKFNGLFMTIMRESIGFGTYFCVYDLLKNEYKYNTEISGGLAGVTNWTITYAIDVIKNRQLSNNISIIEAYKMKNMFSGYKYCLLRAFIVNSLIFSVYEKINNIIN
jgi:solute carrier family 25 carnitine/acylcarnitine transporter 20/29